MTDENTMIDWNFQDCFIFTAKLELSWTFWYLICKICAFSLGNILLWAEKEELVPFFVPISNRLSFNDFQEKRTGPYIIYWTYVKSTHKFLYINMPELPASYGTPFDFIAFFWTFLHIIDYHSCPKRLKNKNILMLQYRCIT